jgi:hypothetical protein
MASYSTHTISQTCTLSTVLLALLAALVVVVAAASTQAASDEQGMFDNNLQLDASGIEQTRLGAERHASRQLTDEDAADVAHEDWQPPPRLPQPEFPLFEGYLDTWVAPYVAAALAVIGLC